LNGSRLRLEEGMERAGGWFGNRSVKTKLFIPFVLLQVGALSAVAIVAIECSRGVIVEMLERRTKVLAQALTAAVPQARAIQETKRADPAVAEAMRQGAIPERDPRMLARAILGLYNSIWHWYRPDQTLLLSTLAKFFTARMLAVAGVPPDGASVQ